MVKKVMRLTEFFAKSGGSVSKILQMKWEFIARPGDFPEGESCGGQGDGNPLPRAPRVPHAALRNPNFRMVPPALLSGHICS